MQNLVPAPLPIPDFTPVPRQHRVDGWTPERQRGFIAALAETGSVTHACRRINMATTGAYQLRLAPGAESFTAAWTAAQAHGVQYLTDIAIDRALDGVSVPVFYKGEQCGEKRWYDNRMLTFLLRHHLPAQYGATLRPGTRSRATIEREAAENCPVCRERREREAAEAERARDPAAPLTPEQNEWIDRIWEKYAAKVRGERQHRLAGEIVAADYALRQLTHIELILVCGGMTQKMIELWTEQRSPYGPQQIFADPISRQLDALRRRVWEAAGEPVRPPLPLYEHSPCPGLGGGPSWSERDQARRAAERRMAEAQAEWEAAAREDSWEEWKARGGRLGEA